MGDYVNGGSESAAVIETLSHHASRHPARAHFLAGNHDLALLDYVRDGNLVPFATLGGVATLASYLSEVHGDVHAAFVRALPDRHRRFLEGLAPCWENEEYLVAHTGFSPDDLTSRSFEALCRKGDPREFSTSGPRPLVVCGHYAQRGGRPFNGTSLICVDTGCGMHGGPLTAVLLPERQFISV